MSFECTLDIYGTRPEVSHNALIRSYNETSRPKYYQKHQSKIKKSFQEKIEENVAQAQLPNFLTSTFNVDFQNDGIYFISNSEQALKYEFGAGNTPPKRFIEPAMIETANEVSQMVISDALDLYERYIR